MKAFMKWFDRVRYNPSLDSVGNAEQYENDAAVWRKALEWVKKEAISLDERGDCIRAVINKELEE